MPERIRINSHPLLAILSHIASKDWSLRPRVFLQPFKMFVHYDKQIRDYLKDLEGKWADPKRPIRRVVESMEAQSNGRDDNQAKFPKASQSRDTAAYDLANLLDSREALLDLRCLVRFMDRYLAPVLRRFDNASLKKIEFEDLWYLFKPGDGVYAPAPKVNTIAMMGDRTAPEKSRRSNRYQTAWRVLHVSGGRSPLTADEETKPLMESRPHDFTMICYYLDFNGAQIGPAVCSFVIKPFESAVDITSLEVFPWRYAPKGPAIRERLRKEGELFREYIDTKHLHYDGTSLTHHPCGRPVQVEGIANHPEAIEGQVIVGFEEGMQIDPGWLSPIGFPDDLPVYSSEVIENYSVRLWTNRDQVTSTDSWNDTIHQDYQIDKLRHSELVESDPFLKAWESRFFNDDDVEVEQELRDEDLILLPTRVLAYVFRERRFALLRLSQLHKCKADSDGFANLKLLRGYKKMVKSLVLTHFMKKKVTQSFGRSNSIDFDVVHGKSKGLVFLLHGVPGVGKTSTAECVAEATGKPLFPITCGDLGLTPEHVEKTLREIFHLAQLWDCVLLLDEADIFLAQRTRTDLKRNALVSVFQLDLYANESVFLRVLEYYSGILFLTTNRVGVIDEAFKSRIHVTLLYPELTERQTQAIWRMNLDRLRKIDRERAERSDDPEMIIDDTAIMDYQKRHFQECRKMNRSWNGRQIRNAFQTASALALFDAHQANISKLNDEAEIEKAVPVLKVEYFEKVSVASSNFDLYISEAAGVGGKSEGERARDRGDRADHLRFSGGAPLEPGTELRSTASNNVNNRRVSGGQDSFRGPQGPPPQYSGLNALREQGNSGFGSPPRGASAQFGPSSNYFDPRQAPSGAGMYDYSQPPGMPVPHPSRQNTMHDFDEDDDE
ncbi:P-loop containing nucleoside triphosphate hydrolase protein [Mytilinidion resinicola]|uniref:P-loop containing nucleoside triphosphate hydrolase protein n=1 Tax=Mytilinidion resinicola TaxID=574789 RepID=A0A6A6XXT4_9PEZI|nr:P-loop containing nucleoside triphosphate hydrolase protein [Mytilinidion resinicola]KAF2801361.1 P-loop containing nucleoside triphosphate hydrolase protein [Mytilinidion resinicola]